MTRIAALLVLVAFAAYAADDTPLIVEVRSGSFIAADAGLVLVPPNPDGGTSGAYSNEPMLMLTGKRIAGCEAKVAVYEADAGEGPDTTFAIYAASAVIVGIGLGYAVGRLSEKK